MPTLEALSVTGRRVSDHSLAAAFSFVIMMKWTLIGFLLFVLAASPSSGGRSLVKRQAFLCKVPKVCQLWCRISGHSNGTCNEESNDCICSQDSVDRHFCSDEYDAEEQHTICAGWCQFKGQQTGDCNSAGNCECVEKELEGDHLKCVSDAVCKMYCHFDKKAATGKCQGEHGWDCVCYDDPEANTIKE